MSPRFVAPLLAAALLAVAALAAATARPNLVLILVDDLGYADVGFQGASDIPTPHLDALARGGVRCTAGYVTASVCSPSRAGLISGRMQQRFGHELNPKPGDPRAGLPADLPTLPGLLGRAGHAAGGVGKWHLGYTPDAHPLARGFSEWFGFVGGGHTYFVDRKASEEYSRPILRGREPTAFEPGEYLTDVLSREALAFVERRRAQPFFLYLAYNAPHGPLQAPDALLERVRGIADERRRTYAAMVCAIDDGVGALVARLRELGLQERTLIVFLSDNGGPTRANASDNRPLRGVKGGHYEGGIRVPFVLSWPGSLPAGEYNHPVSALDLLPTAAGLAGVDAPPGTEGVDLLPYLRGEKQGPPHEALFWRRRDDRAARVGDWKWIENHGEPAQLYDLGRDSSEAHDLAAEQPGVVAEIRARFAAWDASNIAPAFPGLNDP